MTRLPSVRINLNELSEPPREVTVHEEMPTDLHRYEPPPLPKPHAEVEFLRLPKGEYWIVAVFHRCNGGDVDHAEIWPTEAEARERVDGLIVEILFHHLGEEAKDLPPEKLCEIFEEEQECFTIGVFYADSHVKLSDAPKNPVRRCS